VLSESAGTPALDFLGLLWAVDHDLQAFSKRMENQIGVTGAQRLALRLIGRRPKLPSGTLAEQMRLHPSTVTGIVSRLHRKRLISRSKDRQDGRRVLLSLTAGGAAINRSTQGTVEAAVRRVLRESDAVELFSVRTMLARLRHQLEVESARSRPAS
jgi:DNA-binding MarR family transcriptional regulator